MKGLGWQRDLPDIRDHFFSAPPVVRYRSIPDKFDLRPQMPHVYDQGTLGSCTAQAVGAICDFKYRKKEGWEPSPLFLYYVTRALEGTIPVDSGATIRNTVKAVNEFGICQELDWPYDINKFSEQPSPTSYVIALDHQALKYQRIRQNLDDLRYVLTDENPIAFGFSVYESFYRLTSTDYIIKTPGVNEEMLGGHAVVIVGYDDDLQCFIIRNSWGKDWGNDGYFLMPYVFALNPRLCADFWTIELMEETVEEFTG